MGKEEAPLKHNSSESNSKSNLDEVELEKMHNAIKERDELFNSMSIYEKKLMKGLMRGFANSMILWLISQKRQHGYEIMTKLHESTPYENKMPSASKIYPVLHDLEEHGLITGSWEHQGKRKLKYYEITDEGQETLLRFKKMAQYARKNKSSLWLEFIKDMMMDKGELNL